MTQEDRNQYNILEAQTNLQAQRVVSEMGRDEWNS